MKIMLASLMLLSFTLLISADVWMDDFERDEIGEPWIQITWCVDDATLNWKIEDGILRGRWPHWDGQMLFLPEYHSLDYTIQVKCRIDNVWQLPELAGAGLIFRCTGLEGQCIGAFYGYGIWQHMCGFFINGGAPDTWAITETVPTEHIGDEWHTLKLVVMGSNFLGYLDDELVCRWSNSSHKGRYLGISMASNIDASFDDFMISDRIDEDALTDFAVSPEGRLTDIWGNIKQRSCQ